MLSESEHPQCHPFLKWAGGKTQLLDKIIPLIPNEIETYHEPFIGGGAVFFRLASQRPNLKAKLSDTNEDLINGYVIIQNHVEDLIYSLDSISQDYFSSNDKEKFFYKTREAYNTSKDKLERTKYMIFLNKTCFNGLYRVNRSGEFNVPYGDNKKPKILDKENLLAINKLLTKIDVDFQVLDYEQSLELCKKNDLCYLDPPYEPEKDQGFTNYTKNSFDQENQKRLSKVIERLTQKNTKIILSNSESKLIHNLYPGNKYTILKLPALRIINSDSTNRKGTVELVIMNFTHP